MLKEEDKRLNFQEKTYLLHYFTIMNFEEAKKALFLENFPPGVFKPSIHKLLDRSDMGHLKLDYSVSGYGTTDFKYYESLPLASVIKLAKDYYLELAELEALQKRNTSDIDKAISVSFTPNTFRVIGAEVYFELMIFNMGLKDIKECYGHLSVTDSFGEILIHGQLALNSGPYERLSVLRFKELMDQTIWATSAMIVNKEVSHSALEKINKMGVEKLLLKYEPTRIVFSDGTSLIK